MTHRVGTSAIEQPRQGMAAELAFEGTINHCMSRDECVEWTGIALAHFGLKKPGWRQSGYWISLRDR